MLRGLDGDESPSLGRLGHLGFSGEATIAAVIREAYNCSV